MFPNLLLLSIFLTLNLLINSSIVKKRKLNDLPHRLPLKANLKDTQNLELKSEDPFRLAYIPISSKDKPLVIAYQTEPSCSIFLIRKHSKSLLRNLSFYKVSHQNITLFSNGYIYKDAVFMIYKDLFILIFTL